MPRSVSLGQMKLRARRRADMEKSTFIKEDELTQYVNDSIAELYDILVQKFGNDYYIESHEFTTQPGVRAYDLPEDFFKLKGVDLVRGGEDNITLKPFMFVERNRRTFFDNFRYRIIGKQLKFLRPEGSRNIVVWYVPSAPILEDDEDTFDGINGWEEYVIVDVGIKLLNKEESDPSVLMAEKMALKQRIEEAADNRDEGASERVTDVRTMRADDYLFFDEFLQ